MSTHPEILARMHCRGKQPCPSILKCHLHNDAFHRRRSMEKYACALSLNPLNDVSTVVRLFNSIMGASPGQETHHCLQLHTAHQR